MNPRLFRPQASGADLLGDIDNTVADAGPVHASGVRVPRARARVKTGAMVSVVGAVLLAGCSSATPAPAPTVTVTAAPSIKVVTFNPATSGSLLAAKIVKRAKSAGMTVTGVECRNFPNIKVGTATNCQMRVKGVEQGLRATFTLRDGHYVLKTQKLTW